MPQEIEKNSCRIFEILGSTNVSEVKLNQLLGQIQRSGGLRILRQDMPHKKKQFGKTIFQFDKTTF